MKKSKVISHAKLKKKLWKVFSEYIRKRGKGVCFTCDSPGNTGSNYHAGHFIKASVGGLALYFNEDNVQGQCARCNLWLDGNQYIFGIRLGETKVKELQEIKNRTISKNFPFQEKIEYYKQKIKELDENI